MNHTTPAHSLEEVLSRHGVKPTSVRLLVWQQCERQTKTFSLADLEEPWRRFTAEQQTER